MLWELYGAVRPSWEHAGCVRRHRTVFRYAAEPLVALAGNRAVSGTAQESGKETEGLGRPVAADQVERGTDGGLPFNGAPVGPEDDGIAVQREDLKGAQAFGRGPLKGSEAQGMVALAFPPQETPNGTMAEGAPAVKE